MKTDKPIKVLIVTYYWPPSGGAGVQRWLKFTKYLPEFGIEPIVLTVDPRKASYPEKDESLKNDIHPKLKVYTSNSFEALNLLSSFIGKKNVASGGFSNVNKSSLLQTILRFIRGNFFLPDARKGWNKFAILKARELINKHQIEIIVTTSPPHSTQLIGLQLKKELGVKWIADFRDPWTDIYYYKDLLLRPKAKRKDADYEMQVLQNADLIISNCMSNKNLLSSKLKQNIQSKFMVITNGFDEEDFQKEKVLPNEFVITYSGTMSEMYQPNVFFKAFAALIADFPETRFVFRLVGRAAPEVHQLIAEHKLENNAEFIPYVEHSKLIDYLLSSTALLYIFPKTQNDKGIAGKLFEYLAAKRIVVGLGPEDGDSAAILKECHAGKMFERNNYIELYNFLKEIHLKWKNTSAILPESKVYLQYSRRNLSEKLATLLKETHV